MLSIAEIQAMIRDIPDFPQKGIMFKDITPLLRDHQGLRDTVAAMAEPYRNAKIDAVVAIEARGYILGAPIAAHLGVGFVPVRKVGKLPFHTYRVEYTLEYGSNTVEMHQDGLSAGDQVVIIDDVLATGGTLAASAQLVEQSGAKVAAMGVLLEIAALRGRDLLKGYQLHALLQC